MDGAIENDHRRREAAVQYLLLIYDDERHWATLSPEESQAIMKEYSDFTQAVKREGIHRGGEALQATAAAKTVRVRDGAVQVTDGPFAETKEQLGGYYVVECDSIEEAIEAARRIPSARSGSIEVRPVADLPPEYAAGG
jgi:hypothetical protein